MLFLATVLLTTTEYNDDDANRVVKFPPVYRLVDAEDEAQAALKVEKLMTVDDPYGMSTRVDVTIHKTIT